MEEVLLLAADAAEGGRRLSDHLESTGVSIDITGGLFENTAFLEAILRNNATAVTTLVLEGADMFVTNNEGDTGLILSARLGSCEVLEILLQNGCSAPSILNKKNFYGHSALFEACTMGHNHVVAMLLDANADPTSSDDAQTTCLIEVCRLGNATIVENLLRLGVNPSLMNESGETALLVACEQGHSSIATSLLKFKASVSIKDKVVSTVF